VNSTCPEVARFFDASPNPYLVLDRRLHIAAANRAYLESTGRELADIVGRWAWDAFPTDPETERQAVASFERVIATKRPDTMPLLRFDIPRADPAGGFEQRYWSLIHAPVIGDDGEVAYIIQHALDVTELERLRGAIDPAGNNAPHLEPAHVGIFERADSVYRENLVLMAEGERLRTLFQKAPGFICALAGPDHVFEFANDAYLRHIGGRDVIGLPLQEALPELADQEFPDLLDKVYQTGEPFIGSGMATDLWEGPVGPSTRRYVDFVYQPITDKEGNVTGIFVEGQDVTERKAADDRLRESEERNRRIVEGVKDYSVFTTDVDGHIVDWTRGAEAVFGWSGEEIVGGSAEILFRPEDRAAGVPAHELDEARRTGCSNDERWHLRKDGSRFFANGSVRPLHSAGGDLAGFIKIARDETERRAADTAQRESEARLRALTEASNDVLYRMSADWGEMRQLEGGEFLASTHDPSRAWLMNYIPPEDRARVTAAIDAAIRNKTVFELEHRVRRADGTVGWTVSRAVPLLDADGEIAEWFGAASDVTAQHEAEDRLRELNETLERQVAERTAERDRMWHTSPDLMLVIDFEGVFRRVNPAWTSLLGYRSDELVGHHVNEFVLPDDHDETVDAYETAAVGGQPKIENRYRHKDGSIRWISWVAAPAGDMTYATGRDVTAQREMHAKLRDEQDFARLALSAVGGVGVWTYDAPTDRFFCDAAISALYALDPERGAAGLLREEFLANVHPQDRERLQQVMAGGLERAGELELEYRLVHPDGSVRWVMSRGHTYFDASGKPVRRTGVGIDMTSQRQFEEQLRQSQKMEAVGQLTGGIAHDFNNLLTAVTGGLELLSHRIAAGEYDKLDRYMGMALTGAQRAAALTQRLLAFSRRQTLAPVALDADRLVASMEEIIDRTLGPAIDLKVVATPGLWPVLVDQSQLDNALLNLCINARDAMPDGGKLTIETANKTLDARAAADHELAEGDYVSLCVTDTGTGMTPEVIARVFDPFFTTKPIGEGTGLGLSMIYGFVRQSGGQVRIYSEVGQGTTMCLYLPRFVGAHDLVDAERPAAMRHRAEMGETVLLVEDEEAIRTLVIEILGDAGYRVLTASNGPLGVALLQSDERIDLLVTDVGLPGGLNGRQVADAGRAIRPDLKVLFVTGYAANAAVGAGHLDEGMAVLTKPFNVLELERRVGEMIAG
jgi:PAS domain S-box-containing protein